MECAQTTRSLTCKWTNEEGERDALEKTIGIPTSHALLIWYCWVEEVKVQFAQLPILGNKINSSMARVSRIFIIACCYSFCHLMLLLKGVWLHKTITEPVATYLPVETSYQTVAIKCRSAQLNLEVYLSVGHNLLLLGPSGKSSTRPQHRLSRAFLATHRLNSIFTS